MAVMFFQQRSVFLGRRSTSHVDGPCSGTTPLAGMVDDRRPNGIHDARGEAVDLTVTHDLLVRLTSGMDGLLGVAGMMTLLVIMDHS